MMIKGWRFGGGKEGEAASSEAIRKVDLIVGWHSPGLNLRKKSTVYIRCKDGDNLTLCRFFPTES